jgi:hypothetical protein
MLFIVGNENTKYWWCRLFIRGIYECFQNKNIQYENAGNVIDVSTKAKEDDIIFCISGIINTTGKGTRNALTIMKNNKVKIFIYNTEDIKNSENFKNNLSGILNTKAFCVMDFSKERLDTLVYTPNKIKVCPGYYSSLEIKLEKKSKIYDVLCYGTMNERRLKLKEELEKVGLNVLFKCYEQEQEQTDAIMESKIILDTYYYGVTGIDFFRCNFLAANKIFFIHETPSQEDTDDDFLNTVVHASYEDIPQRCIEWLSKSEEERKEKALEVHNLFKTKYNLQDQFPYEFFK